MAELMHDRLRIRTMRGKDAEKARAIALRLQHTYEDFVAGKEVDNPTEVLTRAIKGMSPVRQREVLSLVVPEAGKVTGESRVALEHDAHRFFYGRALEENMGLEKAVPSPVKFAAVPPSTAAPVPVAGDASKSLVRYAAPAKEPDWVFGKATTPAAETSLARYAPPAKDPNWTFGRGARTLPARSPVDGGGAVEAAPEAIKKAGGIAAFLNRIPKGVKVWGGRALTGLAAADLAIRAVDATQGREDRLRAQRGEVVEGELGELAGIGRDELRTANATKYVETRESIKEGVGLGQYLNEKEAAKQQVGLELARQRNDILGISLRSEPTSLEYVGAVQHLLGGS